MKPSCGCNKNKKQFINRTNTGTQIKTVPMKTVPIKTTASLPNKIPDKLPTKIPDKLPTKIPDKLPTKVPTKIIKKPEINTVKPVVPTVLPHIKHVKPDLSKTPQVNNANKESIKKEDYSKYTSKQLRSWEVIHMKAKEATTDESKQKFLEYIEYLGKNFPCSKCSPHIRKYLKANPLKLFGGKFIEEFENGVDVSISLWSWKFHNDVNKRLHRRIMSWEKYKDKYYS